MGVLLAHRALCIRLVRRSRRKDLRRPPHHGGARSPTLAATAALPTGSELERSSPGICSDSINPLHSCAASQADRKIKSLCARRAPSSRCVRRAHPFPLELRVACTQLNGEANCASHSSGEPRCLRYCSLFPVTHHGTAHSAGSGGDRPGCRSRNRTVTRIVRDESAVRSSIRGDRRPGLGSWARPTGAIRLPGSTPAARWVASGYPTSSCSTACGSASTATGSGATKTTSGWGTCGPTCPPPTAYQPAAPTSCPRCLRRAGWADAALRQQPDHHAARRRTFRADGLLPVGRDQAQPNAGQSRRTRRRFGASTCCSATRAHRVHRTSPHTIGPPRSAASLSPYATETGKDFRGPQDPAVICPASGPSAPPQPKRCDDTEYGKGAGGQLATRSSSKPAR